MNEYSEANKIMASLEKCATDLTQWQKQVVHHHLRLALVAGHEKNDIQVVLKKQEASVN